ncbi:nucleotidyltransferase family protein [Nocardioides iriomotensis]|uniref:Nucleotidyltransferase family protein n=1 Tax=Nocardioides iriomotensis TaxID=715784 RepID=A0A4Q5J6P3_9ACTN|nr:nucleotidyltransferase family protein [Nocardioides iriomotensis]RYU13449.1 nucleotidyltransferase family protein [Nocardioides iriomotensis]
MSVAGLLLAAGAGRRMGTPKALVRDQRGVPFVDRAIGRLLDGGCERVTVVLGAAADDVRALLDVAGWCDDDAVDVVVADDWAEGMGASLRAGLRALDAAPREVTAVLVSLVDLPDVDEAVAARVLDRGSGTDVLARASYDGTPGHPVLLGRAHWAGIADTASGDRGARDYLRDRDVVDVECGDLATGRDVDTPDQIGP